jgi:hypothetical protein
MLTFRNSMSLVVAAVVAVAIGMLVRAHQTATESPSNALAVVGSPIGELHGVAIKAPEYWFPRASTHAAELVRVNHEGF